MSTPAVASVRAVSDLHIGYEQNQEIVEQLRPRHPDDLLLLVGDVAERYADIEWALRLLADRFAQVVWCPGNHELWTHPSDPVRLRGAARYQRLVELCRELGVLTPEDPYRIWDGAGGPVAIAPLFVLYDYTFRTPGAGSKDESLRQAYDAGVVCADERFIDPHPYAAVEDWCAARIEYTEQRLAQHDPSVPMLLANHWPLTRTPTDILRFPEFAQWCGTTRTGDWHRRFDVAGIVYGHLHIPRVIWEDGVRTEEVSLGYPREWAHHDPARERLRVVVPAPAA